MCDSMEPARSPAVPRCLEAGPPLANVMEKGRHFRAASPPLLAPLFSFVPLWRMTLDILFTYLTMDERKEGCEKESSPGSRGNFDKFKWMEILLAIVFF